MGLEGWPLHTSWAITYGLVFTAVAVSVTVTCCLSFMTKSSPSLLFVSLLLFNLSELAFGMLVSQHAVTCVSGFMPSRLQQPLHAPDMQAC